MGLRLSLVALEKIRRVNGKSGAELENLMRDVKLTRQVPEFKRGGVDVEIIVVQTPDGCGWVASLTYASRLSIARCSVHLDRHNMELRPDTFSHQRLCRLQTQLGANMLFIDLLYVCTYIVCPDSNAAPSSPLTRSCNCTLHMIHTLSHLAAKKKGECANGSAKDHISTASLQHITKGQSERGTKFEDSKKVRRTQTTL